MNDQLASAQFEERVLRQKTEESVLVDEEFQQFIVGMLPVVMSSV